MPTLKCNVSCQYCFIHPSSKNMSIEDVKLIFIKFREYAKKENCKEINFYWQGGEAMLLGIKWYDQVRKLNENIFLKGNNLTINNYLQTNLLKYSSDWKPIMKDFFVNRVSTSMDYPNLYRIFSDGGNSKAYENLWKKKFFQARNDGINVNIISLLNKNSIELDPNVYFEYYSNELDLTCWQINLPHLGKSEVVNKEVLITSNKKIGKFLTALFDISQNYKNIIIEPLNAIYERITTGFSSTLPCIFSSSCTNSLLAISPNGNVSNCDCLAGTNADFIYGNIFNNEMETIINSKNRGYFRSRLQHLVKKECGSCEYLTLCFGGCPVRSGDMRSKEFYTADRYCQAYKIIFGHLVNYKLSYV